MSEAAIRALLNTAVNTVSNVGKVYDYERWTNGWDTFLDLFKTTIGTTPQIRGWDIGYRGFIAERDPQFARKTIHRHTFWVQGYMRLNDALASEKDAAALSTAVCNAIDASAALHATVYHNTGPASLEQFEPRTYGSTLCHYSRIVVIVPEQVN
jgi:hypothetical protein